MSFFPRAADLLDAWGGKAAALLLGAAFALLLAAGMPKLASNPFETDLLALLPGRLDEAAFFGHAQHGQTRRIHTAELYFSCIHPADPQFLFTGSMGGYARRQTGKFCTRRTAAA